MTVELTRLVERITALDPYLACGLGRDDADRPWWTAAELGSDGPFLERLANAYGERWGVAGDRRSQASYIVLDLSWYAFAPAVASLLVADTVPSLRDAAVALDPATRIGRLALAPAAPRRPASVGDLRHEIEGWMEPVVAAVTDRRWLGLKPAWWGVGDRVVGAFEYLAGLLGDEERGRELASDLVHHPGSPLDSPRHRFATFDHRGERRTIGLRAVCCRFHRIPGEEKCLTCPLLAPEDRERRIRHELDQARASLAVVP